MFMHSILDRIPCLSNNSAICQIIYCLNCRITFFKKIIQPFAMSLFNSKFLALVVGMDDFDFTIALYY